MADVVIKNGTVVDGSGGPAFKACVVVVDGKVTDIAADSPDGELTINADGLQVAPGFIDIHSHADFTLLVDPRATSALSQGVTLEVLGNCGHGCFPVRDRALAGTAIYGVDDSIPLNWRGCADYLTALENAQPAVNVLTLVPNGQLRQAVTGIKDGKAAPDKLAAMIRLLDEGLDAGAFGFSTGLEYPLEQGADRNEIVSLLHSVARKDGLYATHTGVRPQVSHLLPRGPSEDGERCIELVDDAHRHGQDVVFDMHTRKFSMTFLHAMLPVWALKNGLAGIGPLIGDRDLRSRILKHESMLSRLGWHRIVLLDNAVVPEFARMTMDEIGREMGLPANEAALRLVELARNHQKPLMIVAPIYSGADQQRAFAHDLCIPGSDAVTLAPDGPLAETAFHGAYDWAAWFYRFAVHRPGFLSREEAVHRMTGRPADILGLRDRGRIRHGAMADIAIFDDQQFCETTDLWSPNKLASGCNTFWSTGRWHLQTGLSPNSAGAASSE